MLHNDCVLYEVWANINVGYRNCECGLWYGVIIFLQLPVLSLLTLTTIYWILRCMALFQPGQMPYLTMLTKVKHNSCVRSVIWIRSKMCWVHLWPMLQHCTKFHENQSFFRSPADKLTNSTSLCFARSRLCVKPHLEFSRIILISILVCRLRHVSQSHALSLNHPPQPLS